jgi:glycosyltransferase involved in cell wall biosynthesis
VKILFLVPHPLQKSPSQRFRFEQYFSKLDEKGIRYHVQPFLDDNTWQLFFKPGNTLAKTLALSRGFLKRARICFSLHRFDFVFVHREAAPIGPPVFEWIIARLLRRKLIFDFDDAIWTTDVQHEPWGVRLLKCRGKVKAICRWSYKVSCGNQYLSEFAQHVNSRAVVNPTTIDTDRILNTRYPNVNGSVTIGWTGSHSTLKYLTVLQPILQRLEKEFPQLQIVIIANKRPDLNLNSLKFINWTIENEISDLSLIDIGLMPLPDDAWSKGKCGFKILQYMSLSIPSVASPVGVNTLLINDGHSGFLARNESQWYEALKTLIKDETLRRTIGDRGRIIVENQYSVNSNSDNFLSLFA